MISILLIFVFSCAASFIGSLQLGPVNLFVINSALHGGKKTAYGVAIGGCLPEFIYCSLAVFTNNYLVKYDWLVFLFRIAFIFILIMIGLIFYFKRQAVIPLKGQSDFEIQPFTNTSKGFSLAMFNPQLLLFWMFAQIYFNSTGFLKLYSGGTKLAFILGSGAGAFILLVLLVKIVIKQKERIHGYVNNQYYFKILSLLFLAIAAHQLLLLI